MIVIGSDHAGIQLKNHIINYFKDKNIEYIDIDDNFCDLNDYPDIAYEICKNVLKSEENIGIAICGTGIGMSIACNKINGIRAALITDCYMAKMCKEHNNANVICLGERLESSSNHNNIINMVDTYINSKFLGDRHKRRIDKIMQIEDGRYYGDSL